MPADYIDYRQARPEYMNTFVEELINWKKVRHRLCIMKARALTPHLADVADLQLSFFDVICSSDPCIKDEQLAA